MINKKYRVEPVTGTNYWAVIFSYIVNWEDPNELGAPGDEQEETLFRGTLPECEAYINLHKQGMI